MNVNVGLMSKKFKGIVIRMVKNGMKKFVIILGINFLIGFWIWLVNNIIKIMGMIEEV